MNFKLVNKVVYRICEPTPQIAAKTLGICVSDLFAEGNLGLWKAYRTFKLVKGNQWSTYAGTCISNEVTGFLRKSLAYKNFFVSKELETKHVDYQMSHLQNNKLGMIETAYPALTDKQKQLFQLCYLKDMPQSEARIILGLSRTGCSELHTRMITVIKKEVEKQLGG